MKVKVSEASRPVLDWMVAKAIGLKVDPLPGLSVWSSTSWERYSADWSQGGPIIEGGRITVEIKHDGWWLACTYDLNDDKQNLFIARDPLTAAMRAFVASTLGNEVEVPEELLTGIAKGGAA